MEKSVSEATLCVSVITPSNLNSSIFFIYVFMVIHFNMWPVITEILGDLSSFTLLTLYTIPHCFNPCYSTAVEFWILIGQNCFIFL